MAGSAYLDPSGAIYYSTTGGGGGASPLPIVHQQAAPSATYATPEPTVEAAPPPDPYAQWGGQAKYNSLVSGFDTQHQATTNSTNQAIATAARQRGSSIEDFITQLVQGQGKLDEQGVQNELSKKQGFGSIMDMVGHGLQSGGVMLANKNAGDSSASEALARAYGDIGRRQLNKVGNQYELKNREIGQAQDVFNTNRGTQLRHFGEDEQNQADSISNAARTQLAALDAQIASNSLPNRIAVDPETAAARARAMAAFQGQDAGLNQRAGAVAPTSTDARRATAFGLANAGVAATNPFDFTSQAPAQFQGTGPFASEVPLFSNRGKKQTA